MFATLALAAMSFGPAQGGLSLTNDRITFGGEFGPTRPDNRFLPGDIFFLAFDIEGLKPTTQGRVEYSMEMSVTHDETGKVIYKPERPSEAAQLLPLGASKLPARAYVHLGLDLKGAYTCRVNVTDKATNQAKVVEKKFVVGNPEFGIVCFHTSYDQEANHPAPMLGVAGQTLWLHFVTVGFARDAAMKQPNNEVTLRVLDSTGKPTNDEPLAYVINKGVKDVNGIDWDLPLPMNRPGTYTVELTAKDKLSNKEYRMRFSIQVFNSVK
jgi:hypothetical protein